jgi:hypothetical protein
MGTGAIFPGLKPPGREADHSPSSAEVKNSGAIPPLPHRFSCHSTSLINHRDNFTFFIAINILQPTAAANFIIMQLIIIQFKTLFIQRGESKLN